MQFTKSWFKIIGANGLILGLSLCIIEFGALYMGMIFQSQMNIIYIFIIEFMLFRAVRKLRDENLGGQISFIEAFISALFICISAGFIWAVYRYVEYILVPGIVEERLNNLVEAVRASNMTEIQKESSITLYRNIINSFSMSFIFTFIIVMTIGGAILSLFLSFLLQKRKPVN